MARINVTKWNDDIIFNLIMLKYKTSEDVIHALEKDLKLLNSDEKIEQVRSLLENEQTYLISLRRSGRIIELGDIYNDFIIYVKKLYETMTKQKTGFQSRLTDADISYLYENLGDFIDKNKTSESNFKAALKSEPLPSGFKPVIWLVAKLSLREFLERISGYLNRDGNYYLPNQVVNNTIPNLFHDKIANAIVLNKPKKDQYSKRIGLIEKLTKDF
jgi:hypothetical protein